MPSPLKVSIIGTGTVGSVIAMALFKKGYPIASLINRTGAPAKLLAKRVRCTRVSTVADDIARETRILCIAVSDDAILPIVEQLQRLKSVNYKQMFIIHFSGVHTTALLQPLKRRGAIVASIHPVQSFPRNTPLHRNLPLLRGCYYGIEGDDTALTRAEKFVADLGGKTIVISRELKPLYHATCVFASNYFVVLINAIKELAASAKIYLSWTEIFGPLMTSSMRHAIDIGPAAALTGPMVRRDITTLRTHVKSLDQAAPQLVPLYIICAIEAARILKQSGRMSQEEYSGILKELKNTLHTTTK